MNKSREYGARSRWVGHDLKGQLRDEDAALWESTRLAHTRPWLQAPVLQTAAVICDVGVVRGGACLQSPHLGIETRKMGDSRLFTATEQV